MSEVIKIGFFDMETLTLKPRHPELVVVESAALLTVDLPVDTFDRSTFDIWVGELLEVLWDLANGRWGTRTGLAGANSHSNGNAVLHTVLFDYEEQIAKGRVFEQSVADWHHKNGYKFEELTGRRSVVGALRYLSQHLAEVDVLFVRGPDFDISILGRLYKDFTDLEEPFKYRVPHDIRSAIDELCNDFVYSGQFTRKREEIALMASPESGSEQCCKNVATALNYYEQLSALKHRADVDVVCDALAYFSLKSTTLPTMPKSK